ncbi:MAG: thymidylate synthase, partial [Actinomycetota bacterium]|nr:thymidylate synthase [Actinomycetota bacterium]
MTDTIETPAAEASIDVTDSPTGAIRPGDKPNELLVFDHGFVRLDDCMANDLSVINSARVSFAVRKEEMDDRDKGLIKFLMRDRHGTPFEHNSFRFHVRTPIFVAREWFRHRISSFNEES